MRSTPGNISANAGGLLIWPAKLMLLLGFVLLALQGISEIIKRIAVMREVIHDPIRIMRHIRRSNPVDPGQLQPEFAPAVDVHSRRTSRSTMIELIARNHGADHVRQSLVVFLLLGYPVAFALAANGLLFFVIGVGWRPTQTARSTCSGRCCRRCPTGSGG